MGNLSELRLAMVDYCDGPLPIAPAEMAAELVELRRLCDRLEVRFSAVAADFAATQESDDQEALSPIDWIRHNCKMSGYAAYQRVCVGDQLPVMPQTIEAMEQGQVGFGHVALMARTARCLSESSTGRGFEETALLEKAIGLSVAGFANICHHARHADDPEGYKKDEALAAELRKLRLTSCEDGTVLIDGQLDSAGGAALRAALEPLATKSGAHDDRRREQRMADALVELAVHAMDTGVIPQRASQRTNLQVTTSLETLLGMMGSPAAEMEFSLPISSKMVERLACDCTVTRILLGSDSTVIDVGRAKRVVNGALRRALNATQKHCQWPGCERTASWTQSHHFKHWTKGGQTDLENLVLLCHRHHWKVHEGGWQLVRSDDGFVAVPPPITFFRIQHPAELRHTETASLQPVPAPGRSLPAGPL